MSKIIPLVLFLFGLLMVPSHSEAGLFTKFQGTSPSCISCHSINVAGYSGNYLAADISTSYEDFGEDSFPEFLKEIPFKVMADAYAANPLTDEEISALLEEMKNISNIKAPDFILYKNHAVTGIAIFIIFIIVLRFGLYRKRSGK